MPLRLTEQHAMSLITPHLNPGEEVLYKLHGIEQPWWTYLIRIGGLFWKYFVIAATSQRVLLIQHSTFFKEKNFESITWSDLESAEMGWGVFMKPLTLAAPRLKWKHKISIPRFSAFKGNLESAFGVIATWQKQKQLPAAASS